MEVVIRNLVASEVAEIIEWARQEGWNPGLRDAAVFHEIAPDAFWGAFVGDELAASISLINYQNQFGFLGLYICKPAFRGRGIGLALWTEVMKRNSELPCIGLDGVVAQQENYRKSGYQYAFANSRFGGLRPDPGSQLHAGLRKIEFADLVDVLSFEKKHSIFPAERAHFADVWFRNCQSLGMWTEGKLAGYGSIRPCHDGYKVGPWVADTSTNASVILAGLFSLIPSAMVYIDVPMPNTSAVKIVEALGFQSSFETARMYRGKAPRLDLEKTFGVTTLELG